MLKKLFILLALAAAMWQPAAAGELTFGWNLVNESGNIWDMEFMPDNNYFILGTSTDIQIRNTETGALVNTYPIGAGQIEFTPDSTRIITIAADTIPKIQVRNLNDMSIVNEFILPSGTDTAGYNIVSSSIGFLEIAVDPIRPYVYVLRSRQGYLNGNKYFVIRKIVIYNYETMEEVGVLTTKEEENLTFEKMAISNDGKYLAVNNGDAPTIRVWDLSTRNQIRAFKLGDYNSNPNPGGVPTCTKFSELNTDLIYFSGSFIKTYTPLQFHGILVYSIAEDRIVDSTFAITPNNVYQGYFSFFNNEEKAMYCSNETAKVSILNLLNKSIERQIQTGAGEPYAWMKIINVNHSFIGFAGENFSMGKYDSTLAIEEGEQIIQILYPNPTNSTIQIINDFPQNNIFYEIYGINGNFVLRSDLLQVSNNQVTIDLSNYYAGIYILKLHCGNIIYSYKIVKED